jgi:NADH-quinone oxidoreductase subunit M
VFLSLVIFLPLVGGVLGAFLPRRWAAPFATSAALLTLVYALVALFRFDQHAAGVQFVTDRSWIPELGIRYSLGIDGLNLWLVVVTAVATGIARGCSSST